MSSINGSARHKTERNKRASGGFSMIILRTHRPIKYVQVEDRYKSKKKVIKIKL